MKHQSDLDYKYRCELISQASTDQHTQKVFMDLLYITAFIAPGESFAVEFIVIKHFGCESLNVQSSCCLDVVVYMFNCVFWRISRWKLSLKVVAQTAMYSGIIYERGKYLQESVHRNY